MLDFFLKLFDTSDFPARWNCGNWDPFVGWLHITSDAAIFMAYAAIPLTIAYYIRVKRHEVIFPLLYWCFAIFILSCGLTHLIDATVFWHPVYRLAGLVKFITAVASWTTVIVLARILPTALALPGTARLNTELQREIEEREASENALQASAMRLKIAMDHSRLGDWIWEPETDKTSFSPRALEIFGLPVDSQLQWAQISQQLHPVDRERMRNAAADAWKHHTDYEMEYRVTRPNDGRVVWVSARGRGQYPTDGPAIAMIGTVQDITDRKNIEAERERLLNNERIARVEAERAGLMKDEFIATLSHELRTPLNAILGWTHLLKDEDDLVQTRSGLAVIERNAQLQSQLVGDLLDMNAIITGKVRLNIQPVDLRTVVADTIASVHPSAETKNIQIATDFDPQASLVPGDPTRLQQIFWNLITNAIKFTPHDGHISISVRDVSNHVEVLVSDSGQGIPKDFLPHVFDRFRQENSTITRKFGGLGLGLAIVKNLVEAHGGTISAHSDGPDQGAIFTLQFPFATDRPEAARIDTETKPEG